jgi:hypothetical protein
MLLFFMFLLCLGSLYGVPADACVPSVAGFPVLLTILLFLAPMFLILSLLLLTSHLWAVYLFLLPFSCRHPSIAGNSTVVGISAVAVAVTVLINVKYLFAGDPAVAFVPAAHAIPTCDAPYFSWCSLK